MRFTPLLLGLALAGCASTRPQAPADVFFLRLATLCGQSFQGRIVTTDAADADMQGKPLTMHVRDCNAREIRIPFAVGDDRSRTWVVTRTGAGLRLKHDHRHADGTEDTRSQYGGDAVRPASAERIEFPVDAFSKTLFVKEGIPQSTTNVWALELKPGELFAYELRRPGRHFRVEFPLPGA